MKTRHLHFPSASPCGTLFASPPRLRAEPGLEIFELLLELRERHRARLLLLLRARRAHDGKQLGPRGVTLRAADASHRQLLALQARFAARIAAARGPEAAVSRSGALSAALGSRAGREAWGGAVVDSRAGLEAVGTSGTYIGMPSSAALIVVGRLPFGEVALEMRLCVEVAQFPEVVVVADQTRRL